MNFNIEKKRATILELTNTIHTLSEEVDGAFGCALNAQLEVLRVLEDPTLLTTCVDSVLQHLLHGIEVANSESEVKLLRKDSSLLIQTLLFVTQANLIKKSQENRTELIGLLTQATDCSLVFIEVLITALAAQNKVPSKVAMLSETIVRLKQTNSAEKTNLIKATYNVIFAFFKSKKDNVAYYVSIDLIYEKLFRYKELVGTSIILAESVRNNSESLIKHSVQADKEFIDKIKKGFDEVKLRNYICFFVSAAIFTVCISYYLLWSFVEFFSDIENFNSYFFLLPVAIYGTGYSINLLKKQAIQKQIREAEAQLSEKESLLREKYSFIAKALTPNLSDFPK